MKFFIFIFLIFSMKTFAHHPGHKIEANEPYPSVTLEILEDNMDGYICAKVGEYVERYRDFRTYLSITIFSNGFDFLLEA